MEGVGAVRARDEVAVGAIDALELDLAGPLELRGIGVSGTLALPEVEDAGRVDPFLRGLAPVPRRQRAVGLPRPSRELERTGAITLIVRSETADGSSSVLAVRESCHQSPSRRLIRPSVSIAFRSVWLIWRTIAGVVSGSYRIVVRPSKSVGSLAPFA